MDPEFYRARETKARAVLAAAVVTSGFHLTAHAAVRDALRTILSNGAERQGHSGDWLSRCNEATADIAGNQAAAEFATALAQRDGANPNDDPGALDSKLCREVWLREMLHQAGGLVGGYL